MGGEKHEMLTWKFGFRAAAAAAAAHSAAFAAWPLLPKCCCRMAVLFASDYTAVRATCQELQPFCFLTERACMG